MGARMPSKTFFVAIALSCSFLSGLSSFSAGEKQLKRGGAWSKETQNSPDLKAAQKNAEAEPNDPVKQNDYGWALRLHGEPQKAEPLLQKAIQIDPKIAYIHSNLSVVEMDLNKPQDALVEGKKAIDLDANQPIFHVVYGNALLATGDAKTAITQYQTAIKQREDYENAYYNLGRAFQKDGQRNEALTALSNALKLDDKDDRVIKLMDEITK
jgi:predicted Zn-dependent protease